MVPPNENIQFSSARQRLPPCFLNCGETASGAVTLEHECRKIFFPLQCIDWLLSLALHSLVKSNHLFVVFDYCSILNTTESLPSARVIEAHVSDGFPL